MRGLFCALVLLALTASAQTQAPETTTAIETTTTVAMTTTAVVTTTAASTTAAPTCNSTWANWFQVDSASCTAAATCHTELCACYQTGLATLTGASKFGLCANPTTIPNCTTVKTCATNFFTCLNKAAQETSSCSVLAPLKAKIADVVDKGVSFDKSDLKVGCTNAACAVISAVPFAGTACAAQASTVCTTPVFFRGRLRLGGAKWVDVFNNAARLAEAKAGIKRDLETLLGIIGIIIRAIYLSTSRRQANSLVVEFDVPGQTTTSPTFAAALVTLGTTTSWLTTTTAVYVTAGGSASEVTNQGVVNITPILSTTQAATTGAPFGTTTTLSPFTTAGPVSGSTAITVAVAIAAVIAAALL